MLEPHSPDHKTPGELKEELGVLRRATSLIAYRDTAGKRHVVELDGSQSALMIGRAPSCGVWLDWDLEVSSLHAELERLGAHWVVRDEGLSRNGTWLNGERIAGARRLRDGDLLRCGRVELRFREPAVVSAGTAAAAVDDRPAAPVLSAAQRRVLLALCRPLARGEPFAAPATNQEIATELVLSVDAVKTHLRALFERFELGELPQNRKRLRLAELAFERRAVFPRDFDEAGGRV